MGKREHEQRRSHMTRRSFVKIGALAGGTAMLAGLSACGGQHVLEASEALGVGSRVYELVEVG